MSKRLVKGEYMLGCLSDNTEKYCSYCICFTHADMILYIAHFKQLEVPEVDMIYVTVEKVFLRIKFKVQKLC